MGAESSIRAQRAWLLAPNPPPGLPLVSVVEQGLVFETGRPVSFTYVRNTVPSPDLGTKVQQHIEPAGRYMLLKYDDDPPPMDPSGRVKWETGEVHFERPLVIAFNTDPHAWNLYGETSWKAALHRAYGLTGEALSEALVADDYDAVVTVGLDAQGRPLDTREILQLYPPPESATKRESPRQNPVDARGFVTGGHVHLVRGHRAVDVYVENVYQGRAWEVPDRREPYWTWAHVDGTTGGTERFTEDGAVDAMFGHYKRRVRAGLENPSASPDRPFEFWLSCPQMSYELVHYITDPDRAKKITYKTFARHANLEPLRAEGHPALYRMSAPDNWAISFWKSKLPSGAPIYYFDWSRIEHVFVHRDLWPSFADEHALAVSALRSGNPRYGPARPGRVPTWVRPSSEARKTAGEALRRQKKLPKSKRGGLTKAQAKKQGITSGVERAKSIARGDLQPAEDLRDFFNRFSGTYQDALAQGKAWEDSKVQQAWDLWGGDAMRKDAMKALSQRNPSGGPQPRDVVDLALSFTHGPIGLGGIDSVIINDPTLATPPWWNANWRTPPAYFIGPLMESPKLTQPVMPPAVGAIFADLYVWVRAYGGISSAPGRLWRGHLDSREFDSYSELADALIQLAEVGTADRVPSPGDPPDLSEVVGDGRVVVHPVHGTHRDLAKGILDFLDTHWPAKSAHLRQRWYVTEDSEPLPEIDLHDPTSYAVGGEVGVDDQWYFEALTEAMEELAPDGCWFGAHDSTSEWGFWCEEDEDG